MPPRPPPAVHSHLNSLASSSIDCWGRQWRSQTCFLGAATGLSVRRWANIPSPSHRLTGGGRYKLASPTGKRERLTRHTRTQLYTQGLELVDLYFCLWFVLPWLGKRVTWAVCRDRVCPGSDGNFIRTNYITVDQIYMYMYKYMYIKDRYNHICI